LGKSSSLQYGAMLIVSRKTEVALEFVWRLHDITPTIPIFWFRPEDLRSSSAANPAASLEEYLKADHTPDSLLVVDPGENFEILQNGIPDFGTLIDKLRGFAGTIILLARSVQNGRLLAAPRDVYELGDLEIDASINLLRTNLGNPAYATASESQIREMAQLMTCSPRAMIQAANLINNTGMTASQFLEMYQAGDEMKLRLFSKLDPVSQPPHNVSVIRRGIFNIKAFRSTFTNVFRILYQMYALGGTSVPRSIFSSIDRLDMIITIYLLKGHFLAVEDESNGTYTIHPLVYLTLRKLFESQRTQVEEDDIQEESKWLEEVALAFPKQYPDANNDDRSW
jgi:hypothetical protein